MRLTESINIRKPRALAKGGTIGITAPSSQINIDNVSRAVKFLRQSGFNVKIDETILHVMDNDYNSASAEMRSDGFNGMLADDEVDVIWAAAGGFGAQMTMEGVNIDAIMENPKPIIGFSDTTYLLNAIYEKTGLITFLGPTAEYVGDEDKTCFNYAINVLQGKYQYPHSVDNFNGNIIRRLSANTDENAGVIVGGNLTMLQTTLGTDFEVETDGKILLLEEIGESSYSIERSLRHLQLAGKFDDPAAVIFGEFSNIKREPVEKAHDGNPSINEILVKMFRTVDYPVLIGYNFSHDKYNLTLPIGAIGKVNGDQRTFSILENPVT